MPTSESFKVDPALLAVMNFVVGELMGLSMRPAAEPIRDDLDEVIAQLAQTSCIDHPVALEVIERVQARSEGAP